MILHFLLSVSILFFYIEISHGRSVHNRNSPHCHRGLLVPYSPGPFQNFHLDPKDEDELAQGKPVMKQIATTSTTTSTDKSTSKNPEDDTSSSSAGGQGGRAICIQDIHASKEAVWRQILDVDAYEGKVAKVKECKNYSFTVHHKSPTVVRFKTKMVVGVMPGYSYENYYDHTYYPKDDSVTWSLDYDKSSDFDDVAGHWHVEDHPTKDGFSRVFYACDIKFKNPVPGPILNFLTKVALKNATSWVKKESEEHPQDAIPTQYAILETTTGTKSGSTSTSKEENAKEESRAFFGKKAKQLFGLPQVNVSPMTRKKFGFSQ